MSLGVLAYSFIADPASQERTLANPIAGEPCTFDVAFGPGASAVYSTALTCSGATIDATSDENTTHTNGLTGYVAVGMGWKPDNVPFWLGPGQAVQAFWHITFPSAGSYSLVLANVGTTVVTVNAAPSGPTPPVYWVIDFNPLNRKPSVILGLSYNGTYPSGGLDLASAQIGLQGVQYAGINDTASYRFSWTANKLHVFNSSGEVSGSINFTTAGLFIGSS